MRPVAGTSFLFSERTLEEQLAEGERVLVQTKRHPVVLWKPVGRAFLALVLWAWYVFEVPNPGKILDVLSVVVLALAAWVVWCEWERRHNRFIITDQRLLLYEGIITRKVPMMRLSKVTDVTYFRSVPGRILGYGTIIIESAGQDQAMHNLTYLPEPDSVYAELNGALFGRKAKEKAVAGNRRGMRRRRRGDGAGGDPGGPDTPGGSGPIGGPGGSGGPGPSGDSGDSGDSGGYGGSGSPDGTGGGFLLPFDDEPAYDIDSTDVPPAGYPSSGARPAYEDTGTIYSSSRRRAAEDDTGPIPIKDWPRRTR